MASGFSSRAWLFVPLLLLTVVLLEQIAVYYVHEHVDQPHLRTAIIMALYGIGFTLAADQVVPWLKRTLNKVRKGSKKGAGILGLVLFYGLAYGVLFVAYHEMQTRGVGSLLPVVIR
jgi:Na+/melibiose symporter-like transporter